MAEHSGITSPDRVRELSSRAVGTVATLLELSERGKDPTTPTPTTEGFVLSVPVTGVYEREAWLDGQSDSKLHTIRPGSFSFMDLRRNACFLFRSPFSIVQLYVPRTALDAVSDELASTRISEFSVPVLSANEDPIVQALAESILPSFAMEQVVSSLYVDSVLRAASVHLATNYGRISPLRTVRGGLAAWQERRIKDIFDANLPGELALADLAEECRVSISHFTRAFRTTFGVAPHRFLIDRRIERAKDFMTSSTMSLSEIALFCGFSDQSHFTRVFTAKVGTTPGRWRGRISLDEPMPLQEPSTGPGVAAAIFNANAAGEPSS